MTEAVQAAVEGTAYSFDALFTYLVPEELCGRISAGMRVVCLLYTSDAADE